jgi:hypothetical protein
VTRSDLPRRTQSTQRKRAQSDLLDLCVLRVLCGEDCRGEGRRYSGLVR